MYWFGTPFTSCGQETEQALLLQHYSQHGTQRGLLLARAN